MPAAFLDTDTQEDITKIHHPSLTCKILRYDHGRVMWNELQHLIK